MTITTPELDLDATEIKIQAARKMIDDLCQGRRTWSLRIPVQNDDPDVVISAALDSIESLVTEVKRRGRLLEDLR